MKGANKSLQAPAAANDAWANDQDRALVSLFSLRLGDWEYNPLGIPVPRLPLRLRSGLKAKSGRHDCGWGLRISQGARLICLGHGHYDDACVVREPGAVALLART